MAIKSFLQGGNTVPPLPHIPHQEKDARASPLATQNESTSLTFWLDSLLTLRAGNECVKPEGQRGLSTVSKVSGLGGKESFRLPIPRPKEFTAIRIRTGFTAWPIYCGYWQKQPLGFGFKNPFLILQVKLGSPDS